MEKTIEFLLTANDRASQVFEKVGAASDTLGTRFGSAVKTMTTGALLGAGAAAGAAIANVAREAFSGAKEAAQVTRVLESQIRNLGPAGQQAFGSAADFADQLSASIGKDDDDIKKVQTKLASFPGAFAAGSLGAEAMRRATSAAFDLEAIGIGAAESNIIGIGKALDNPIKGMTALSKAGVSFSEAQKEAIKQAVAQGDLAKAQSIILEGIESNAKGAAAASTDNIEKIKVVLGNMAEGLAGKVLPLIEQFAGFLLEKAPQIEAFFSGIANGVSSVVGWFTQAGEGSSALSTSMGGAFTQIWAAVGPVLTQIWTIIQDQVVPAFKAFVAGATPIVTWLVGTLGPVVSSIFQGILTVIKGALTVVSGVLNVFAGLFTGDWNRLWSGIKQIVSGAWTAIKGLFSVGISAISGVMSVAVGTLKAVATRIGQGILDGVKAVIGKMAGIGSDIINGLVNGIQGAAGRVWAAAQSVVDRIPLTIRKAMGIASPSKVTRALGANLMSSLGLGMQDEAGAVERTFSNLNLQAPTASGIGAGGLAGGGLVVQIYTHSVGDEAFLVREIRQAFNSAVDRGLIPSAARL